MDCVQEYWEKLHNQFLWELLALGRPNLRTVRLAAARPSLSLRARPHDMRCPAMFWSQPHHRSMRTTPSRRSQH